MSMSLAAFAPELLIAVVANIDSKPALCNLARCSRKLYLCTVPRLYHHVTLQEEIRHGEQSGQLRNTACLLIRRPELASLVRNFTLHVVRPKETEEPERSEKPVRSHSVQVDEALKTAMNAWGLSKKSKNKWLKLLSRAHIKHLDLILALLLPGLPKLERLVLDFAIGHDTLFLEKMIQRAARRERPFDTQTPFETLTSFVYSHDKSIKLEPLSTDFIALLLQLPAIQEISGSFKSLHDDFRKDLIELDNSSSPLSHLDLTASSLGIPDLGHILQAPKTLKSFLYKIYPTGQNIFTDVCNALEPQKHCLESLSLVWVRDKSYGYWSSRFCGPMPPFISFTSLKVFKTAVIFLEATCNGIEPHRLINIFPPSLETLHVTHIHLYDMRNFKALECLLEHKSPQQVPLLNKLVLDETGILNGVVGWLDVVSLPGSNETLSRRLSRLAAAQGVSVEIRREFVDP